MARGRELDANENVAQVGEARNEVANLKLAGAAAPRGNTNVETWTQAELATREGRC